MSNEWEEGGQAVQSNWFRFVKPGDFIKGTLMNKRFRPAQGIFGDSWNYEILTKDGSMNVSVAASKEGTVARINRCQIGEVIGIMYEKDIPPASGKGFPAKALTVKTWGMDQNYNADGSVNLDTLGKDVTDKEMDVENIPFD